MTPPAQPRTGNEQRIAALEAEVVTMREALEDSLSGWHYIQERHGRMLGVGWDRVEKLARSALSSSADYAGKVVVDREEWKALLKLEKHAREWGDSSEDVDDLAAQLRICIIDLPRLDSLRQGATHES